MRSPPLLASGYESFLLGRSECFVRFALERMVSMFEQQARDFIGYGATPPDPKWPGGARIAVNFNLNYEGGGESTLANGDDVSEGMLNDIGVPTKAGMRVPLVESVFEYGSRSGVWRVLRVFKEFDIQVSILGVVRALEQNPV